jgi:hypothetical protein
MTEPFSWLLPAAESAYKHREAIAGAWERLTTWLLGKKHTIAFSGCAGVGKTVLLDHLDGAAFRAGYHPPDESQKQEKGSISRQEKRIRLVTIPGQTSGPRFQAFNEIMSDKETVDGIVHVVANGFASLRSETAREIWVRDENVRTIQEYRATQMKIELEDLRNTCAFIRRSHQRHHRPSWLIVAVAKIDLYYDQLDAARVAYSPLGRSEFSTVLNELRSEIGGDFFRWDAAPVCTWLQDFVWNGQTVKCGLLPNERDHYVASFAERLQSFC